MGLFNKQKKVTDDDEIVMPVDGEVYPISKTSDSLFASKAMGDGVMIKPKGNRVYSPCDGIIEALFPSKHAIGIRRVDGSALLIHFGLETAKLNGRGFDLFVKKGGKVKKGKLLMEVDLAYIREHADDDCVIMTISELIHPKEMKFCYGTHKYGDAIISFE